MKLSDAQTGSQLSLRVAPAFVDISTIHLCTKREAELGP